MKALLLLLVVVNADICMYQAYGSNHPCYFNGTLCIDRTCPKCNDAEVANTVINDMTLLNYTIANGNVTADNQTDITYVYSLIRRDIQYARDSYNWEYKIDHGAKCTIKYTKPCTYNTHICYQQDCNICKSGKICTYVNTDLNTINNVMKTKYFKGNNMQTIFNMISDTIKYCKVYSSATKTEISLINTMLIALSVIYLYN